MWGIRENDERVCDCPGPWHSLRCPEDGQWTPHLMLLSGLRRSPDDYEEHDH